MAKITLNLTGAAPAKAYFKGVDDRLHALGYVRADLARTMNVAQDQLTRLWNHKNPNPTLNTIISIEDAIVTLRQRRARTDQELERRSSSAQENDGEG